MMDFITNFDWPEFQYPWVFALGIVLLALLYYGAVRREPSVALPSLRLLPKARPAISFSRVLPLVFYGIGGLMLLFALAGPRYVDGEIKQKFQGVDIMMAVDISGSMAYFDVPKTMGSREIEMAHASGKLRPRLDVCKEALKNFVKARPNDRFGLIAFANQAYSVCPPTLDHTFLNEQIDEMTLGTPDGLGTGTGIAAPIVSAIERTKESTAKRKVMVLFTDGANTVQNLLTPLQAAELADSDYHMTVYTVGIGSNRVVAEGIDFFGRKQLTQISDQFDEPLLKSIAEKTHGRYYAVSDLEGMKAALAQIDKLEKKSEELPRYTLYRNCSAPFTAAAALFMLAGYFCTQLIFLRYP